MALGLSFDEARTMPEWDGYEGQRLQMCKEILKEIKAGTMKWEDFIFSDECMVRGEDRRRGSWVPEGVRCKPRHVRRYCPKLHIWGFIGVNSRKIIRLPAKGSGPKGGVTADDYIQTLQTHLLPALRGKTVIWMQDGASIHTAKKVIEWLNAHGVRCLDWSPYSPDLNPIENYWGRLKAAMGKTPRFRFRGVKPQDIWGSVQKEYRRLPMEYTNRLVMSFEDHIMECLENKGGEN